MPEIKNIYIDGSLYGVIDNDAPVFSWSILSYEKDAYQKSFRIDVFDCSTPILSGAIWSEVKETREQNIRYDGPALIGGKSYLVSLTVTDNTGKTTKPYSCRFTQGKLEWDAEWISPGEHKPEAVYEFSKEIDISKDIKDCKLFICGLGYHKAFVNGEEIPGGVLAPSVSNYNKTCYYEVLDVNTKFLARGLNEITFILGSGWRQINTLQMGYTYAFSGIPQITGMLKLEYADGREEWVKTDADWKWRLTPYVSATIFGGTVFDERVSRGEWQSVYVVDGPGGVLRADTLEPIVTKKIYAPQSIICPEKGVFIIDFGQNIAGYCCIKLPGYMEEGHAVTLRHAEELDEEGKLFTAPLRDAAQKDMFISAGGLSERNWFFPIFTYHGFRYAEVTGVDFLQESDIYAVAIYNDIDLKSRFSCGSPVLDKVHNTCVMTEKANIHSILTDCPQRDERMGWLNDASVRFEATPYNFNIGRIFPKIVRDAINEQIDGMITCTAPFVYGCRPADPVCSSFLIAGLEAYMFTGNEDILEEAYEPYKAWEEYLLSRSTDYIVDYSYYGDWAGPAYACFDEENAKSKLTPGEFMSTGYSYLNCVLLSKFATILGKEEEAQHYFQLSENIKNAILKKWFNEETCIVGTGSHACHAFALWLKIIPEEYRQRVCDILKDDLVKNDYRFTTGNLCSRYILDVLTEYGYGDCAYEILTKDTYPSIGYMIQHEATTVWERFELKKNPGMNSHNHPMYAAADYWFYAYILGIKPSEKAFDSVDIKPYFPSKLLSANGAVETIKGNIQVRWANRFGNIHFYVDIPFGVTANVYLPGKEPVKVGSGSHYFMI